MLQTEMVQETQVTTCPYYLHPKKCTRFAGPNSTYKPPCFEDTSEYLECAIYTIDVSDYDWPIPEPPTLPCHWDEEKQEYVLDLDDEELD